MNNLQNWRLFEKYNNELISWAKTIADVLWEEVPAEVTTACLEHLSSSTIGIILTASGLEEDLIKKEKLYYDDVEENTRDCIVLFRVISGHFHKKRNIPTFPRQSIPILIQITLRLVFLITPSPHLPCT